MLQLNVPLNFVFQPDFLWPEIIDDNIAALDDDALAARATSSQAVWVGASYVIFRRHGHPVTWSRRLPRNDAVNVVAARAFGRGQRGPCPFILCARSDAHDMKMANFVLEQNGLSDPAAHRASVPHWPQFGLKHRDPARGDRIERLTFKGETINLDPGLRDSAFHAALERRGVRFEGAVRYADGSVDWTDYREADLVLAARNMTLADARNKPASKLVNAWHAGVPALLGPEPAFRELRRSALDYIEVTGPRDVLAAVETLKADPGRYRAMIGNGRDRARDFTEAAILARWIEILNGPVQAAFRRWQARPVLVKAAWWGRAQMGEERARRRYKREIREGPRLYAEPPTSG